MDWKTQETTRLYLHPEGSSRMVLLMRDFKLVNLALHTETHTGQEGFSLTITDSCGDLLPWKESRFGPVEGGLPIYCLKVCHGNGNVSFRVFCDTETDPLTHFTLTVENPGAVPVEGSLYLTPCTAENDRYLTGLWDTGYMSYAPNPRAQTMLENRYRFDGQTLTDGTGAAKLRRVDGFGIAFTGSDPDFFRPSNRLELKYSLEAGGSCSLEGIWGSAERVAQTETDEDSESSVREYWNAFYDRLSVYPDTDDSRLEIWKTQIMTCLQMLQRFTDGCIYPRQGCVARFIWPWEAVHFLTALDRIGLADLTVPAYETLLNRWIRTDPDDPDCGLIDDPHVHWANTNGSVIWGVSEHLKACRDRGQFDRFFPLLELAVRWIEKRRNETGPDEYPRLFPSSVASDWGEVGQHYTYTDSVNVMGYRSFCEMLEVYGHPAAGQYRSLWKDYSVALEGAIHSLEKGHAPDEDYMPTHILSKEFREVRTHCYTTDGIIYLPMCGNLDPSSPLFGFAERFYRRHGLIEHGLTARISNLDWGEPGVYGDCYYTNVAEIAWMYALLQQDRAEDAEAMLDTVYRYNLTGEHIASERYTPLDPWYAPWQPNASASGRIIHAMLDLYGTIGEEKLHPFPTAPVHR